MEQLNAFVLSLNNRLQHLPIETRQRRIKKIMDDVATLSDGEPSDIFTPLENLCDDDGDWDAEREEIACENDLDRKERIRNLRAFYSTLPDDDEVEEAREFVVKKRCGKNDLHDAVMMGDCNLIRQLIAQGVDPQEKNNNGHTAIYLAFLEENKNVIALFRELGIITTAA